jgi:hypothetical protein
MAAAATSARSDALQNLHTGMAAITSTRSLSEVLEAVAEGAVRWLEFGAACVNLAEEDGTFRVVAVAGSEAARKALLGRRYEREAFEAEFARAETWGRLLFVPHDRVGPNEEDPGWVPRLRIVDDPHSWHPLDALFAPMQGSSGELVGVLSVDLPRGGRRPDATQCDLLEIYATHAGLTIERVRLADELQQERDRLHASDEAFRLAFHGAAVGCRSSAWLEAIWVASGPSTPRCAACSVAPPTRSLDNRSH